MTDKIDLTRLNRDARRRIMKNSNVVVPGRNLPYVKSKYVSLAEFNALREKEIAAEKPQ